MWGWYGSGCPGTYTIADASARVPGGSEWLRLRPHLPELAAPRVLGGRISDVLDGDHADPIRTEEALKAVIDASLHLLAGESRQGLQPEGQRAGSGSDRLEPVDTGHFLDHAC